MAKLFPRRRGPWAKPRPQQPRPDKTIGDNLHVFRVMIEEHGFEEVAFQGITRSESNGRLQEWLRLEPFVKLPEVGP